MIIQLDIHLLEDLLLDHILKLFMNPGMEFNYDPAMSLLVKSYLQNDARKVLLIYGGNDPWTASAVETGGNKNIVRIVQPGGSHRTRIGTLPESQKQRVMKTLQRWLK
jgi:hypothetical protein